MSENGQPNNNAAAEYPAPQAKSDHQPEPEPGYERKYTSLSMRAARLIANGLLKLMGWKLASPLPAYRKAVVVGGPHTSNWDFLFTMLFALHWQANIKWLGKDSLFKPPFGTIMRKMGGIPVDRSKSTNLVDQVVETLNKTDELMLVTTPEGTRGKVTRWRTGFYHIATGAGIPIIAIYCDYAKKEGGCAVVVHPSGDFEADVKKIRDYWDSVTPKNPDRIGKTQA